MLSRMLYNRMLWRVQSKVLAFVLCLTFAFPARSSYARRMTVALSRASNLLILLSREASLTAQIGL